MCIEFLFTDRRYRQFVGSHGSYPSIRCNSARLPDCHIVSSEMLGEPLGSTRSGTVLSASAPMFASSKAARDAGTRISFAVIIARRSLFGGATERRAHCSVFLSSSSYLGRRGRPHQTVAIPPTNGQSNTARFCDNRKWFFTLTCSPVSEETVRAFGTRVVRPKGPLGDQLKRLHARARC